jgi:hypothetical protein
LYGILPTNSNSWGFIVGQTSLLWGGFSTGTTMMQKPSLYIQQSYRSSDSCTTNSGIFNIPLSQTTLGIIDRGLWFVSDDYTTYFKGTHLNFKKQHIDFTAATPNKNTCDVLPTSIFTRKAGTLQTVYYEPMTSTFRIPFEDEDAGNSPFDFDTCKAADRIFIQIDDSKLQTAGYFPIVYFDDAKQEFVFVGGYSPPFDTYEITVWGFIQTEFSFKHASFSFDLVIGSAPMLEDEVEVAAEEEVISECDSSSTVLTNFQPSYSMTFTVGNLLFHSLPFSDTLDGACLA